MVDRPGLTLSEVLHSRALYIIDTCDYIFVTTGEYGNMTFKEPIFNNFVIRNPSNSVPRNMESFETRMACKSKRRSQHKLDVQFLGRKTFLKVRKKDVPYGQLVVFPPRMRIHSGVELVAHNIGRISLNCLEQADPATSHLQVLCNKYITRYSQMPSDLIVTRGSLI
jgi:hypothetical protein